MPAFEIAPENRSRRKLVGIIVPSLLVGAAMIGGRLAERHLDAPGWITPLALTLALLASAKLTLIWWQALDEAAQEAHRDSWLWGGTAGLAVSLVALVALTNYPHALSAFLGSKAFIAGWLFALVPFFVGYTVWWAAWWVKRR